MNRRRLVGNSGWILLIGYVLVTMLLHKRGNEFAGSLVIAYGAAAYRAGVEVLTIVVAAIILPLTFRSQATGNVLLC